MLSWKGYNDALSKYKEITRPGPWCSSGGNPSSPPAPCYSSWQNTGNNTEKILTNLKDEQFQNSKLYVELVRIPNVGLTISPEYLYNLLSSGHTEIDDIISKLEKEEIIGGNPTWQWDRNKIVCKLELKDLSFRIQNKK